MSQFTNSQQISQRYETIDLGYVDPCSEARCSDEEDWYYLSDYSVRCMLIAAEGSSPGRTLSFIGLFHFSTTPRTGSLMKKMMNDDGML